MLCESMTFALESGLGLRAMIQWVMLVEESIDSELGSLLEAGSKLVA